MHKNGLVVSLKSNGEILKEIGSEVYIPFNSTYEVYLQNKTSKRCLVDIFVDDKTIIRELLLNCFENTTIKRFHEGNNSEGHSLKFIPLSKEIKQHRGTKSSDGILKVNFKFEKEYKRQDGPQWIYVNDTYQLWPNYTRRVIRDNSGNFDNIFRTYSTCQAYNATFCYQEIPTDQGITTKGKPVEQNFYEVNENISWEWKNYQIILKMFGADRALKKRVQCEMCGCKVNVKQGPYCPKCGTYLL